MCLYLCCRCGSRLCICFLLSDSHAVAKTEPDFLLPVVSSDEVVVKLECLLQLFQKCLVCCCECSISTERDGWFFYVTQKCQQCHYSREWASHPTDQIISDPAESHEVRARCKPDYRDRTTLASEIENLPNFWTRPFYQLASTSSSLLTSWVNWVEISCIKIHR